MRVMVAHVGYRTAGGEESVVSLEASLMTAFGIDVKLLTPLSREFDDLPLVTRARIGATFDDHKFGRAIVRDAIADWRPDVVHFHNLFPLLGPGAVDEARRAGCAVVQTLHNYRFECIAGTHLLNGGICERCSVDNRAPGVRFGCYRRSRAQSLAMSRAQRRLWDDAVRGRGPHRLLPLTDFAARRLTKAGMPSNLVAVKPNSAARSTLQESPRQGVAYVGRLSPEKGILELARRWPADAPELTIAGDGELYEQVKSNERGNVKVVGRVTSEGVRRVLRSSRVALLPSLWFEGMPASALEAYAEDTPVVLFRHSAFATVAQEVDERCVVEGTDFESLIQRAVELHDAGDTLRGRALSVYETRFTNEVNARALAGIYEAALAEANGGTPVE